VESALIARDETEATGSAYRPDAASVRRLAAAHEELSRLVAPATPHCLVLMDEEARSAGMLHFLGPVGLVRRLMGVAVLFLATFIGLALFQGVGPDFDASVRAGGVLSGSGLRLLGNMLFYIASAGLGASFGLLFEVNGFIVTRTFDPKYESSYWIKMVLGMIAGFILVTLVPLDTGAASFALPTVAMLGGFSASAVYRILNRMVQTVESVVRGDAKEMLSAHEATARARSEEESTKARMKMAAGLLQLQQQLSDGAGSEGARRRVNEILSSVMPAAVFDADDVPTPAPRPATNGNGNGNGNGHAAGDDGGAAAAAALAAAASAAAAAAAAASANGGASENGGSAPADTPTVLVGADTPIVSAPPEEEEPAPVPVAAGESGESDESGESGESGGAPADDELDENGAAG
jgi:hypothetical protein